MVFSRFDGQMRDPDFTTEGTEATEAGRKGFRIRTLPSFRSVSVSPVSSVVKKQTMQKFASLISH
jgi:hypothetical protein